MAAILLLSATSLAATLGMAVKNAIALLDRFCADGIAVEVTHRSKRRLYGLAGLAPLRAAVVPPYRRQPGRGRGRPPRLPAEVEAPPPLPPAPLTPLERREFDTSGLEAAMQFAEAAIRRTRRQLETLRAAAPWPLPAGASKEGSPDREDRHESRGTAKIPVRRP